MAPPNPVVPAPDTSVLTGGFARRRYGAALLVATAAIAVFMQVNARGHHGLGAALVLTAATAALVWAGGPARRARRVIARGQMLVVERWTRVVTRIGWDELAAAEVVDAPPRSAGLLLVPRDRTVFFDTHLELRDSATADGALIPLGGRAGVAGEVRALLAAHDARAGSVPPASAAGPEPRTP